MIRLIVGPNIFSGENMIAFWYINEQNAQEDRKTNKKETDTYRLVEQEM
jgi:hypothetical protein